jgi:hypothetical protein
MFKFREHKGSLAESMATTVELNRKTDLIDKIKADLAEFEHGLKINKKTVSITPYAYDERIGWDSHIVRLKGYGVLGFTDGSVNY